VYGALSKEENVFPAIQAIRKKLTIRGTTGILRDDLKIEALKAYVTSGLKSGDFRPIIAKTFPFDRIVDAHRYIESGEQFGKVILTV
jgi:NADPH:quinone reductase-like Zn-dependent oxidoreductase